MWKTNMKRPFKSRNKIELFRVWRTTEIKNSIKYDSWMKRSRIFERVINGFVTLPFPSRENLNLDLREHLVTLYVKIFYDNKEFLLILRLSVATCSRLAGFKNTKNNGQRPLKCEIYKSVETCRLGNKHRTQ